jgi:hypothetical protein
MKKNALIGSIALIIIVVLLYLFLYKSHRDVASESAVYTLTVSQLQEEFVKNDSLSAKKYQDQIITCEGTITEIDSKNNAIVLDKKMYAVLQDKLPSSIKMNQIIQIKGRFLGYDDLLEEFKIDQCQLQN